MSRSSRRIRLTRSTTSGTSLAGADPCEDVAVLVPVIAGLVGAQPGEGLGHRRRFQPDSRNVLEVNGVRHAASWSDVVGPMLTRRRAAGLVLVGLNADTCLA